MDNDDDDFEHLVPFNSDADGSAAKKPRRGPAKTYRKEREFENREKALEFVKNEACWSVRSSNTTKSGQKTCYGCNKRKEDGGPCPALMHLLYHAEKESVSLFRADEHLHDEEKYSGRGMDPAIRIEVTTLYEEGIRTPKKILEELRWKKLPEPSLCQLSNFLTLYKKKRADPGSINFGELQTWCGRRSTPNADQPDRVFVVRSDTGIKDDNTATFRILMSTPRLLEFATKSRIIHVDSTYKINWTDCPVFFAGTSDQDRRFFPIAFGICFCAAADDFEFIFRGLVDGVQAIYGAQYQPDILVAGASDAITEGFSTVFGQDFKRVTCWGNALRDIDKTLNNINDSQTRQLIRDDIVELQLCESESIFDAVAPLFFQKWRPLANQETNEFLDYFESEWINSNKNWYEGYSLNSASTNTGLESVKTQFNTDHSLRSRYPLLKFLEIAEQKIAAEWSRQQNPASEKFVPFATQPTKTTAVWTSAYEWASASNQVLAKARGDGWTDYYVSATDREISPAVANAYRDSLKDLRWRAFGVYVSMRRQLWVVSMFGNQWENASCNCPVFLTEYLCKHTLGVAIRKNFCTVPPAAIPKNTSDSKKKRGRPKALPTYTR